MVWVGSWPSLALLFTYRAEVRVGGRSNEQNLGFVHLYCQLSTIHFLAARRLAEFSDVFVQNVLQRWTGVSQIQRSTGNVDALPAAEPRAGRWLQS